MRSNLPAPHHFIDKVIPNYPNHLIQAHVDSGNNGHLFRAFDASTNSRLAFKIIPDANLPKEQTDTYLQEARNANLIDHPSVVRYHDVVQYAYPDAPTDCVVFVCDFVDGTSLKEYVSKSKLKSEIDISFIVEFLSTVFELLFELDGRGYQHGDLHSGNVLVVRSDFDIDRRPRFRVTDFGVRPLTGSAAHANDYLQTAHTLASLLDCVDYSSATARDRYFFNVLRKEFLQRHLIETDKTIDPLASNAAALYRKLQSLDDSYASAASKNRQVTDLLTPFDYPNCEQIGNSHLLLRALYSDRLLGLSEINARSTVVLTGPRGCGKTTVFRALSLEYQMSIDMDQPEAVRYIGVYYRCDDLYFCFPRYSSPSRPEAIDIPMHYVTATLLGLTLEQLGQWGRRHYMEDWERHLGPLVDELWNLFGWEPSTSPGYRQLGTIVSKLKGQERDRARKKQRFAHVPDEPIRGYFGPDILFAACAILRKRLSFLADRPFYFFIDDYSRPKITGDLQTNLNRLLMHRTSDVFFKISTESPVSFTRHDIDGKVFVESREFDFVNLGLRYITGHRSRVLAFIVDLFEKRFSLVQDFPASSLEALLGSSPRNENAAARLFRGDEGDDKRYGDYAGIETVAAMCSGDIHYIIRLVARMVDDSGGVDALLQSSSSPMISRRGQSRSIRAAAGAFMESIRIVPNSGPLLAEVVTAFGNVARSYVRHKTSKNQSIEQPHQASRIEPYEPLKLSEPARRTLDELLRYSVLIEDPRGMSRRGHVVPRFYLRRYLIPHFRLTFSQRDSIELEPSQIESLLSSPADFEGQERLRVDVNDNSHQQRLL